MTGIKIAEEAVMTNQPEAFKQAGRYTTFRGLFDRQYRGDRVGALASAGMHVQTQTERMFATEALRAARLFEDAMHRLGFQPIDNPEAYILWGPYPPRDNSLYRTQGARAVGYAEGEDPDQESADFILQGWFIAPRGHITAPEPFK